MGLYCTLGCRMRNRQKACLPWIWCWVDREEKRKKERDQEGERKRMKIKKEGHKRKNGERKWKGREGRTAENMNILGGVGIYLAWYNQELLNTEGKNDLPLIIIGIKHNGIQEGCLGSIAQVWRHTSSDQRTQGNLSSSRIPVSS